MATVSTLSSLVYSLKMDDLMMSVLSSVDSNRSGKNQSSLWMIPGIGVLGAGSAAAVLVSFYIAHPQLKEELSETIDILSGVDEVRDEKLEKVAQMIGEKGEETDLSSPPPDKPRVIAEAQPQPLPSPKVEVDGKTPSPQVASTPTPIAIKPAVSPIVSRGSDITRQTSPASTATNRPVNPALAAPTIEINDIIQKSAKSENFDYRTLYAVLGSESSFKAGASAQKSSATGLAQFTAPTWQYLTEKVYPELGYTASDRTDPQKSAVMAARYLKSIQSSLTKKLGRSPSVGETYLGYFMGPTGASRFIDQYAKNPNAKGAEVFPNAAAANPNLFYNKGNKNEPLTLAETMGRLDGKVMAYYDQAGTVKTAKVEIAPPVPDVTQKPKPVAVTIAKSEDAIPQVLPVLAPDFSAVPAGAKGESRTEAMPSIRPKPSTESGSVQVASVGGPSSIAGETTYVRDKNGRLINLRS